jgi:hypothetical protein
LSGKVPLEGLLLVILTTGSTVVSLAGAPIRFNDKSIVPSGAAVVFSGITAGLLVSEDEE